MLRLGYWNLVFSCLIWIGVSLGRWDLVLSFLIRIEVSLGHCGLIIISFFTQFQVSLGCVRVQRIGRCQFQVGQGRCRLFQVSLGQLLRLSQAGISNNLGFLGNLVLKLFLGSCHVMVSSFTYC